MVIGAIETTCPNQTPLDKDLPFLPIEMYLHILSFLGLSKIMQLGVVSKSFYRLSRHPIWIKNYQLSLLECAKEIERGNSLLVKDLQILLDKNHQITTVPSKWELCQKQFQEQLKILKESEIKLKERLVQKHHLTWNRSFEAKASDITYKILSRTIKNGYNELETIEIWDELVTEEQLDKLLDPMRSCSHLIKITIRAKVQIARFVEKVKDIVEKNASLKELHIICYWTEKEQQQILSAIRKNPYSCYQMATPLNWLVDSNKNAS